MIGWSLFLLPSEGVFPYHRGISVAYSIRLRPHSSPLVSVHGPSAVDPDFISAIARIYADLQADSFAVRLPGFLKPSDRDTMRDDRPPVYTTGGKQS
jgi:hypothetical protein